MKILVRNLQKKTTVEITRIKKQITEVLKTEKITTGELSIVFVSDRRIKDLNNKYLSRNYATDVLAFDLRSRAETKSRKIFLNGEIIISVDTAKRNAKIFHTTTANEIKLYIIHGILHLLGYNDTTNNEISLMRIKENKLLLSKK